MIDRKQLLADTRAQVKKLEADLQEVTAEGTELGTQLRAEHAAAFAAKRTGWSDKEWIDDRIAQAAVAWVLAGVFVRFLEDNNLVAEARLAGAGDRARDAQDAKEQYFRQHPANSDVDFLRRVFGHVARHPATASVFDKQHNPLWQLPISGDAARALIEFWRRIDPDRDNELVHDFTDPNLDTRFLGNLYQDLSDHAKKTYALLQTPEFVEEFILDHTLDPAIEAFGLDEASIVDPTCGSGHFLLGAFDRILERWRAREPGTDARELVQRTLHAIHGIDINPFAVAIAKFRLMIAATTACGITRIADAPAYELNLAAGDSLLHGHIEQRLVSANGASDASAGHWYATEDAGAALRILDKRYSAVVGNPPYIAPKDKVLNQEYRARYKSCSGKYALSVPFMERFFDLAASGTTDRPAGFVGKITSNSFMRRGFGKRLVEGFFPTRDVSWIIDSSGAVIPGHNLEGTPTVILMGRNRAPSGDRVNIVRGIRGERTLTIDASAGQVWQGILSATKDESFSNSYVERARVERKVITTHPLIIESDRKSRIVAEINASSEGELSDLLAASGYAVIFGENDVFTWRPRHASERDRYIGRMMKSDQVRNWGADHSECLRPYDEDWNPVLDDELLKDMWPYRSLLRANVYFDRTKDERGLSWYEYANTVKDKLGASRLIVFPLLATHNHFALVEDGALVVTQASPALRLLREEDLSLHFELLAWINSSACCFWLKSCVLFPKNRSLEEWQTDYEFTATNLKSLPLIRGVGASSARRIHELAQSLIALERGSAAIRHEGADRERERIQQALVAEQEEIDWDFYAHVGVAPADLCADRTAFELPLVALGERAFEIALARRIEHGDDETDWFRRHSITPTVDLPNRWPVWYRSIVEARIRLIDEGTQVSVIEQPEFKRRWVFEDWEALRQRALERWLLDRLEDLRSWDDARALSCARLADLMSSDPDVQAAIELWARGDIDPVQAVTRLIAEQSAPYVAPLRYKETGLATRAVWERTWQLQRQEDEIDAERLGTAAADARKQRVVGNIPKPPSYKQGDFLSASYWKLRGKLDMPRERFISYPGLETTDDPSPVIGWAGWNHDERAQALASLIDERERVQGWSGEQLVPLLAGLREVLPWLHQWHSEIDPKFGTGAAGDFEALYEAKLHEHGLSEADLTSWRPPAPLRGRRQKAKA